MSKTRDKSSVPVPDWAQEYNVGDLIEYYNPIKDEMDSSEIIGFSTVYNHKGLPVIDVPDGYEDKADEVVIREQDLKKNGK